jgi:hypothetical protein
MTRRLLFLVVVASLAFSTSAFAGPKEEAHAVLDKFLTEMTANNLDAVLNLFAPDALFWGTTQRELATTPDGIRGYFAPAFGRNKPNQVVSSALGTPSMLVLSDDVVLVSVLWHQVNNGVPNADARLSMAIARRGDRWVIVQFHNSTLPMLRTAPPPATQPQPAAPPQ